MTLVEFLKARLDADAEEIALHPDGQDDWPSYELHAATETNYPCFSYLEIHKKRALAEVEAVRRIIRAHEKWCGGYCEAKYPDVGPDAAYYWAIKVHASVYDQHPEYNESWRP